MFSRDAFVKMYYFAIEFSLEIFYPLVPAQGWEAFRSLTT